MYEKAALSHLRGVRLVMEQLRKTEPDVCVQCGEHHNEDGPHCSMDCASDHFMDIEENIATGN